jgi:hypothetical protein
VKFYYYVYRITNLLDGKFYIGVHKSRDPNDQRYFGSGKRVRRAIAKHGIENFRKEFIQFFDTPAEAFTREKELITPEMIESNECYNMNSGGKGGSCKGHMKDKTKCRAPKSAEQRAKISKALMGKCYHTEDGHRRMVESLIGNQRAKGMTYTHTPEARAAQSRAKLGWKMTDETKAKLSKMRKGKGCGELNAMSNPIHRAKISATHTGQRGLHHPDFPGYRRAHPGSPKWEKLISEGYR